MSKRDKIITLKITLKTKSNAEILGTKEMSDTESVSVI